LADKTHKTKGIVLRTVKYGDTSIVVSIFTELFGLQSYIVNGVRNISKNGSNKAVFFQPATLLDMEVYHNSFKHLHRIKEYRLAEIYGNIFTNILKNGVAQYMVEMLYKCLKEPENNPDLFAFTEDCLFHLNSCSESVMANFPIFFSIQLSRFFGFFPHTTFDNILHDPEFFFTNQLSANEYFLDPKTVSLLTEISLAQQPTDLAQIRANAHFRRKALDTLETYFSFHITDFGKLKTLAVLKELVA
jgi:DNA repair protein RecO (recombination protein O)